MTPRRYKCSPRLFVPQKHRRVGHTIKWFVGLDVRVKLDAGRNKVVFLKSPFTTGHQYKCTVSLRVTNVVANRLHWITNKVLFRLAYLVLWHWGKFCDDLHPLTMFAEFRLMMIRDIVWARWQMLCCSGSSRSIIIRARQHFPSDVLVCRRPPIQLHSSTWGSQMWSRIKCAESRINFCFAWFSWSSDTGGNFPMTFTRQQRSLSFKRITTHIIAGHLNNWAVFIGCSQHWEKLGHVSQE